MDMIQEISLLYIQILKKEAKISQKEMIKSLGASESLLSRWKSGERKIQVFMKNRSSLCIEESGKQKVIGPKQLSKIGWVSDFYLGIKEQVTPEELIYLNQYAEIILQKSLILR